MSYVVLALKWRPQNFEDLTGQEHVARTLTNAIQQDRVPHAILFTGARGVGKTSSARILAMALNCKKGPTPTPCGECEACLEIPKGQSVDVLEIDGASNRGINEIRELRDGVRYAPNRDRHKIYIIDEVHMLTTEAFNALLKTLEEPPKHVVFIFATTEAHKIPVTILSRCQRFDFRRIPHAAIVGRLAHIAAAEGLEIPADVLGIIARQAAGGMRDALSLLDQVISFTGTNVSLDQASEILGAAERRSLFALSDALIGRNPGRALEVLEEVLQFGVDVSYFAGEFVGHLRDLTVLSVSPGATNLTALTDSEAELARQQIASTDPHLLHRMFETMVEAAEQISRSAHAQLRFEMTLVRLTALEPVYPLSRLIEQLERFSQGETLGAPRVGGAGPGSAAAPLLSGPASSLAPPVAHAPAPASVKLAEPEPPMADNRGHDSELVALEASAPSGDIARTTPASDSEIADPIPVSAPALTEALSPSTDAPLVGQEAVSNEPVTLETAATAATGTSVQELQPDASPEASSGAPEVLRALASSEEPGPALAVDMPDSVEAPDPMASSLTASGNDDTHGGGPGQTPSAPEQTPSTSAKVTRDAGKLDVSATDWRQLVDSAKDESRQLGGLLAVAHARPVEDGGVELALPGVHLHRVSEQLLERLNGMARELLDADVHFSVVDADQLPEDELAERYHVATDEERERQIRQQQLELWVSEHDVTQRIMTQWPGSAILAVRPTGISTERTR
ncbi:MAG: DNA polymerase-3 subunit gamma/tau [Bradymonadia bacterium]|jgi:DNA polymerase-3 subunit gamma/tau